MSLTESSFSVFVERPHAYLFEVKEPAESKGPWSYYKVLSSFRPNRHFLPLTESRCSLVKR
jgi:branched-chain amino acid transport system substrate-binding protein